MNIKFNALFLVAAFLWSCLIISSEGDHEIDPVAQHHHHFASRAEDKVARWNTRSTLYKDKEQVATNYFKKKMFKFVADRASDLERWYSKKAAKSYQMLGSRYRKVDMHKEAAHAFGQAAELYENIGQDELAGRNYAQSGYHSYLNGQTKVAIANYKNAAQSYKKSRSVKLANTNDSIVKSLLLTNA